MLYTIGFWESVVSFFDLSTKVFIKKIFTFEGVTNMDGVLEVVLVKVTTEMKISLDAAYTREEVNKALFQMFRPNAWGSMAS